MPQDGCAYGNSRKLVIEADVRVEQETAESVLRGGEDMKVKLMGALTIAVVLLLVFAVVAQAAVPQSIIDQIIKDAKDGHLDGNWTVAQIRAAIRYVENNPIYSAYSKILGTLEDYLASLLGPGEQGGQLAFTGGEMFLILGAGAGLIASGALLRRRRA
jgi:hypothetical protein